MSSLTLKMTHKGLTDDKSRINLLGRPEQDDEVSIAHHIPTLDEHEMRADEGN